MTETKMVKQGIKEDNSIDINEQNITEIIKLKEFPKPKTEPRSLEKDNLNNDSNRQNILSLTNTETINKDFLTKVLRIDSNYERLIPFKSKIEFEELTRANKEKMINDHRGNEGVKPYDLRKDILWKEISFLNKVTILKDVNKERTCRGHLTENSLDEHLTDDDKKKVKQDKEIEICSYSPIAFLHKYQHKVQSPRAKELSRKGIKDGNMDAIFCKKYAWIDSIWTDSIIKIPNKIIINDIFTPFIVSLNIHLTDILIKEALTDSPLLIIKENSNCGNFLNNDRFNFLTNRINYNPLTSFTINKRLYKETLFHMFSQDEIYSNTYRIILDFKNLLNLTYFDRIHHDCFNTATTQ